MQALWPGLLILLAVLCFNFLGDGLRDALGPRMTLGANENYPRQPWRQPGVVLGCEQDSGLRKRIDWLSQTPEGGCQTMSETYARPERLARI